MQHFHTRSPSRAPLLIAVIGFAALAAYGLSSPRRRAALRSAGESALEAGTRLASRSADRLHELLPEQALDSMSNLTATARSASERATSAAAETLHDAVHRATDLMHEVLSRARGLPRDTARETPEEVREAFAPEDDTLEDMRSGRSSARGVMIAAAAIGAGLYAMQRYGASDRVREKLGADESGTIVTEKSVFIDAPVEQVFDTWSDYENFPRFMSNVRSVVPLDDDRAHWKVRGPAGVGVEFDSVTRKHRPNELSWESDPGSTVQNEGRVTLVPEGSGTRATVRMTYRPPAGALGQAVSSLLGANPKQELEDDLNRMKQFIEGQRTGTPQSA
ncbi:SRPBCC family protein [Piscinibacter sp. XHJ-5]|uniref:SRPBCC family protein n=1 Tax=Piscinibacter sp. XHJ-5 TaxID=3037797 RepID=UPI002452E3C3|nr:SRPBCC family protein [Piscinibacter sp. XHJ-5]